MKKFKIKRGDKVVVIAGKDKGKTGEVLNVLRDKDRVVVGGVNLRVKYVKTNEGSERVTVEAPIHISNVMLVDSKGNRTRVGYKFVGDKKVRFAKTTGDQI